MFLVTAFLAINHDISAKKSELPIDTKNIINHRISSTIPIVP
jgi:hypothetical protein